MNLAIFAGMRLSEIRGKLKAVRASQQELADFMGVEHHVVSRIVNHDKPGGRKHLTDEEADAIRRFFALREKPVYETEPQQPETVRGARGGLAVRGEIPLFGGVETAHGRMISLGAEGQVGRVLPHPAQITKRAFAVEVIDETMAPRLRMGEIAYIAVGITPRRGQDVLLELDDMTARLLELVEHGEKQIVLRQLNPEKQVMLRPGGKFTIHAIVGRG